jgi:hypothetical protein
MTTWDNIASNWEFVLPPSRPSVEELERIGSLLCHIDKRCPVAVMGSTIEYRELLFSFGFINVYIFENNMDFYEITTGTSAYTLKETIISGDWVDTINGYEDIFAVILSDLTIGNIPYDKRKAFYASINNALSANGCFADKVLTHSMPHLLLIDIGEKYERLPINFLTINHFSCEALFCSELLNAGIIDTTKFYAILREQFRDSPKLQKYLEKAHLITPEDCIWYYGKYWCEIKEDYFPTNKSSVFFHDGPGSPYFMRLKHFFHIKEVQSE